MGVDVLLVVIVAGLLSICGGFASYGCFRCFTDRTASRVHSENSSVKKELYKNYKRQSNICSCFRQKNPCNQSSASSLTSFTGTIYSVHSDSLSGMSRWSRDTDGKVPLDLLQNYQNFSINSQLENADPDNNACKSGRASTAPA